MNTFFKKSLLLTLITTFLLRAGQDDSYPWLNALMQAYLYVDGQRATPPTAPHYATDSDNWGMQEDGEQEFNDSLDSDSSRIQDSSRIGIAPAHVFIEPTSSTQALEQEESKKSPTKPGIKRKKALARKKSKNYTPKNNQGKKSYEKQLVFHNNFRILRAYSRLTRQTTLKVAKSLRVNSNKLYKYHTYLLHCGERLPSHFSLTADDVKKATRIETIRKRYQLT